MNLSQIEDTALSLLKEYIYSPKSLIFDVASDYSMRPFLRKEDQIIVEKVMIKNLSLGDIVVFHLKDNLCAHRFLYKYRPKENDAYLLITKGDNCINPDYPFREDRLFGKAITIRRKDGEIHLKNTLWRNINYIFGIIYLFEAYLFKILRFIKRLIWKKRKTAYLDPLRKALSLPFFLSSKFIIFILDFFLFIKNRVRKTGNKIRKEDADFSIEDKFILLCSRTEMKENQIQMAKELSNKNLNWGYILQKAGENGVAPLIYQSLKKFNNFAPENVTENLKMAYVASWFNNEPRYEDLREVLRAFNTEGIPVLLYKGAVLGEIVYKDIALRWMFDFDLLVRIEDWTRIVNILSELNFSPFPIQKYFIPERELSSNIPTDYHILYKNIRSTHLEFKFNLYWLDFPKFDSEMIWKNAKSANITGINVSIPFPEDQLLLVSIGLFKHNYRGLIWFCDISELIKHYEKEINWERLIKKSKEKRVSILVYYSLFFTDKLLGAKIPRAIFNELKPNWFRHKLFEFFYNTGNILRLKKDTKKFCPAATLEFKLLLINKISFDPKVLKEIIGYFLKLVFPPVKFMAYRYSLPANSPKVYLYYLERLGKLFYLGFSKIIYKK